MAKKSVSAWRDGGAYGHVVAWVDAVGEHAQLRSDRAALRRILRPAEGDRLGWAVGELRTCYAPLWAAAPQIPDWVLDAALGRVLQTGKWGAMKAEIFRMVRPDRDSALVSVLLGQGGGWTEIGAGRYAHVRPEHANFAVVLHCTAWVDERALHDAISRAWEDRIGPHTMLAAGTKAAHRQGDYGKQVRLFNAFWRWKDGAKDPESIREFHTHLSGPKPGVDPATIWPERADGGDTSVPNKKAVRAMLKRARRWLEPARPIDLGT